MINKMTTLDKIIEKYNLIPVNKKPDLHKRLGKEFGISPISVKNHWFNKNYYSIPEGKSGGTQKRVLSIVVEELKVKKQTA